MAWPRSLLLSITITLGLIAMTHCATPKTKTSSIAQVLEGEEDSDPEPKEWPEQFHALLVMNNTNKPELQVVDLWYDWPNGRNLNLIQNEYGKLLYDVEWNNGTSYYFTLGVNDDGGRECTIRHFEVGVLRPNWLDGANYLGQRYVNGFLCNVWEKVDFIWYYEDVVTKRPVYWLFFTGMEAYVMTFEVGNALEDSKWQAPAHCFDKPAEQSGTLARPARLLRPPVAFS